MWLYYFFNNRTRAWDLREALKWCIKRTEEEEGGEGLAQSYRLQTMGAEGMRVPSPNDINGQAPPLVLGLQASALVDHVARVDWSLLHHIPGDRGGSQPVICPLQPC